MKLTKNGRENIWSVKAGVHQMSDIGKQVSLIKFRNNTYLVLETYLFYSDNKVCTNILFGSIKSANNFRLYHFIIIHHGCFRPKQELLSE